MSFKYLLTLFGFALLWSCGKPQQGVYGPTLNEQLRRTDKVDSLLGGLTFGMTRKQFYDYCNEAHARDEMREGLGLSVRIEIPEKAVPGQAVVEFYPTYSEENSLVTLPGKIYALQWSPWNKELFADSIAQDAMDYLVTTLGGTHFARVEGAPELTYVKLDANRRVTVRPKPQQMLEFDIVDLSSAPDSIRQGYDLLAADRSTTYPFFQPVAHE